MSTPATIAKHPIYPMLVAFPIGLLVFSLVCQLIFVATHSAIWLIVAFYSMGGGIIGALAAAIPGFIDFLSIREPEMKAIAWKHMLTNALGLLIFIANLSLALSGAISLTVELALSIVGVLTFVVGGWLGGEMVYVRGMGVESVEQLSKKIQRAEEAGRGYRRAS